MPIVSCGKTLMVTMPTDGVTCSSILVDFIYVHSELGVMRYKRNAVCNIITFAVTRNITRYIQITFAVTSNITRYIPI